MKKIDAETGKLLKERTRLVAAYNAVSGGIEAVDRFAEKHAGFAYEVKEDGTDVRITANMKNISSQKLVVVGESSGLLAASWTSPYSRQRTEEYIVYGLLNFGSKKKSIEKIMNFVDLRFGG